MNFKKNYYKIISVIKVRYDYMLNKVLEKIEELENDILLQSLTEVDKK